MLEEKRLFILDMDGTVYLGDRLFPQTLPFLRHIKETGGAYIFFTNNASRSRKTYEGRLASMGIPATPDEIMTSGDVTIQFLKTYRDSSKVLLLGTPDLEQSFRQAGIALVQDDPDIVLVSFDTGVTYEKMDRACHYVRNGAEFLSTHPDVNCPVDRGYMVDSGSLCALVTASTGKVPRYFGKPHMETLQMIMERTGCQKEEMVVIGDRLETDIALGALNGVTSVLVLTGVTSRADVETSAIKPDIIVDHIGELFSTGA